MRDADIAAIKAALADIPGIDTLTQANVGGRMVFGFGVSPASFTAGVDPTATTDQIIAALRKVYASRGEAGPSPIQAAPIAQPPLQPQAKPMSTPAPAAGGFAASLRAMMDEARAGVARARVDGLSMVQDAVGKLNEAKDATTHVASSMAKTIQDEAASVMAELGQISNDLTGEG